MGPPLDPTEGAAMPDHDPDHREQTPPTMSRRTRQALEQLEQDVLEARRLGNAVAGHPHIDRRVFELTKIAVARIDRNPSLVQAGLDNIERWTRQKGGYVPLCHAEWKALIEERPWPELRTLLLQDNDEGQRLRSSHPFSGPEFVTEKERATIHAMIPSEWRPK